MSFLTNWIYVFHIYKPICNLQGEQYKLQGWVNKQLEAKIDTDTYQDKSHPNENVTKEEQKR